LLSSDALEIELGNGQKAWYLAISSHPDLLEGNKINQYCDESTTLLKEKLRTSLKSRKKSPPRANFSEKQKEDTRNRQDGKCNKCGKNPPRWEYNHKDGNSNNNVDENCEGLCPNCHSVVTYDET